MIRFHNIVMTTKRATLVTQPVVDGTAAAVVAEEEAGVDGAIMVAEDMKVAGETTGVAGVDEKIQGTEVVGETKRGEVTGEVNL